MPIGAAAAGIISGLIGAGSALAGGIAGGKNARRLQERQNAANMHMAEYAYSKDLEMWNMANAYNSPQAQMKRLEEAGLNPNMVYGSGHATGNQSGQLPKFQAPSMEYNYPHPLEVLPQVISTFQDMQIKMQQLDNMKAQRETMEEDRKQKAFMNQWWNPIKKDFDLAKLNEFKQTTDDRQWLAMWKQLQAEQQFTQKRDSWQYQLEGLKGKNREINQRIDMMIQQGKKLSADTEFRKLENEWYTTKLFSKLGLDVANAIQKFLPGGKAFSTGGSVRKGARQAERDFNQTTRQMGKYNQQRRNMDFNPDYTGYWRVFD